MSTKNLSAPTLDLLTAREAAEILDVSMNTLYTLLRAEKVPHIRLGRKYKLPRDELYQWVHSQAIASVR